MRYLCLILSMTALGEGVGQVSFPVSGSPETRTCFERGVAMLHSFWFEEAQEQFQKCTKAEPAFAMGYWGEAMTYNHSLWGRVWLEEGRAALKKIPAGAKITSRERAYIEAVGLLFGEGKKADREKAYSRAMAKLHQQHPDDLEAAAFYSLSLIALGSERDRIQAGAIALDVYEKNRNHPGAAHYVIHAFDDPIHAILALPAARRYAEIAPEAHHARHMPSHIFLQLGMWPETVKSNEESWAASVAWQKRTNRPIDVRDYHSQYWLAYGYLQLGRYDDAWRVYEEKKRDLIEAEGSGATYRYWGDLGAALIFETGEWEKATTIFDDPVVIRRSGGDHQHGQDAAATARVPKAFTQGFAAARRGQDIRPHIDTLQQARSISEQKDSKAAVQRVDAQILMVEAEAARHRKNFDLAIEKMKRATALEETNAAPSGPPDLIKPTHELYGEILLDAGRPKEAAAQFARSLERQPNRTKSIKGMAEAKKQSGVETH